jgi:hypothetical protein
LKVLKEEIRKPYFLDLKRFLWIEGVRGKEDSDVGKVFPPGESRLPYPFKLQKTEGN